MYEGSVKFIYKSKQVTSTYSSTFPELLPDETVTITSDCYDLNIYQYFELFKKFVRSLGFSDRNIIDGACNLAFNEVNDEKIMREVAGEYELIMSEQLPDIIADSKKQDVEWIEKTDSSWEKRYWEVYNKLVNLENEKRVVEENTNQGVMKVTTNDPMKAWNGFIPGSPEARAQGCICPVLDNEEMPDDKKWIDVECPIHGRK